jgi:hypothetical protein
MFRVRSCLTKVLKNKSVLSAVHSHDLSKEVRKKISVSNGNIKILGLFGKVVTKEEIHDIHNVVDQRIKKLLETDESVKKIMENPELGKNYRAMHVKMEMESRRPGYDKQKPVTESDFQQFVEIGVNNFKNSVY